MPSGKKINAQQKEIYAKRHLFCLRVSVRATQILIGERLALAHPISPSASTNKCSNWSHFYQFRETKIKLNPNNLNCTYYIWQIRKCCRKALAWWRQKKKKICFLQGLPYVLGQTNQLFSGLRKEAEVKILL